MSCCKFEHGVLHHGNCLEIMTDIPDKSIDMILVFAKLRFI